MQLLARDSGKTVAGLSAGKIPLIIVTETFISVWNQSTILLTQRKDLVHSDVNNQVYASSTQ